MDLAGLSPPLPVLNLLSLSEKVHLEISLNNNSYLVIMLVMDVMVVGTTKVLNIMPPTESVLKAHIPIHQEVVPLDLAITHAQKTLSQLVDLNMYVNLLIHLKMLFKKSQYQSVLMLKHGMIITVVSSVIVELKLITVYYLLDTVVTLIG